MTTSAYEIVLVTSSVSHHDFDHNVLFYCKHETQLSSPFETFSYLVMKVRSIEKILKGSLDLISSPSAKIQIMVGKVFLQCKGKTLHTGHCQQTFEDK